MFNLRFSPEYTPPHDQKRSGGIDSSPVREAGSCSRQSVREALTVGPLAFSQDRILECSGASPQGSEPRPLFRRAPTVDG